MTAPKEADMKTREILREEWKTFFDNLSRKQEGWEATLEVFGPEIGDQVEERHMYLAGATAELREKGDMIELMFAGKPPDHLTRTITAPTQVSLQQSELGIDSAVQIKAADGTTSLLHLS
jgi:Family of unknown function (DUF5335)